MFVVIFGSFTCSICSSVSRVHGVSVYGWEVLIEACYFYDCCYDYSLSNIQSAEWLAIVYMIFHNTTVWTCAVSTLVRSKHFGQIFIILCRNDRVDRKQNKLFCVVAEALFPNCLFLAEADLRRFVLQFMADGWNQSFAGQTLECTLAHVRHDLDFMAISIARIVNLMV